jgi:glyoxylate/hydroxypyruvate reductase A
MALMIVMPGFKTKSWVSQFRALDVSLDIRVWPDTGNKKEIEFAVTWNHPRGEFLSYPNLKCIASLGAGVDHILSDPDLPLSVPVTRIVDPSMYQSMSEFVVLAVLNHCRHFEMYLANQRYQKWKPKIPILAQDICIGVMGLGQLGADAAKKLSGIGFRVAGWRRTFQKINHVQIFSGDEALTDFLSQTHILICLLPLTPATQGILNKKTFNLLQPGAYIINVARGEHLVESDLLDAIESGQISGACLDVFRTEPLPEDHPFWSHPKIIVTPHISSLTNPKAVAPQIIENYRRAKSGMSLLNVVDPVRGY